MHWHLPPNGSKSGERQGVHGLRLGREANAASDVNRAMHGLRLGRGVGQPQFGCLRLGLSTPPPEHPAARVLTPQPPAVRGLVGAPS